MGIDTTQAHDHPSTNALDAIPDDLLDLPTPPAYLAFGTTPSGMEAPPEIDEVGIYVIRARCVGASTSERTDGELRHGRKLQIQWCIKQGQPEPPDAEQEQRFRLRNGIGLDAEGRCRGREGLRKTFA